ncbi:MAG: ABC transporter ATP-binding protein [Clostridia bacterium]|nr:ABC transporter ATP-binding protein [Clostridia bacterium]
MDIIKLNAIRKSFSMGKESIEVLKGIDLEIHEGEVVCILGKSGSGKSTLLNMIAGLEKPSSGEIFIKNTPIHKLKESQLAVFRQKHIGFVFQSYNLLPMFTALENVTLPLIFKKMSKRKREKEAKEMLVNVDLADRIHHKPKEMSGGQQQRVSIARAFVGSPEIIFADEPTGNLDTKTTEMVIDLIFRMVRENNQTLVMVTHDDDMAEYADRVIHMKDGQIEKVIKKEKKLYEKVF